MHFLRIASPADLAPPAPPFGIREPTPAQADGALREDAAEMEEPLDAVGGGSGGGTHAALNQRRMQ